MILYGAAKKALAKVEREIGRAETGLERARKGIVGAELTTAFGQLLAEDLAADLERWRRPRRVLLRGSSFGHLVELTGKLLNHDVRERLAKLHSALKHRETATARRSGP
jgi:hypothetical protein